MANHVLKNPPEFNTEMRKMETTDPGHANVFNPLLEQLLNNDAFLKAIADAAKEHMQNGEIHVTEQDKEGWNAKAGTTEATQSAAGLMSAGDKQKLDNVAANAEVNQNALSNIQVGSVTITANGKTATFTMEAGDNITLTADNATKKVTIKSNRDNGNADTLDGYHAAHFAAADHRHIQGDNWRQGTDLPSTYPKGETIFFSNNPTNKFNGFTYCTVHTIKGYSDNVPACIQFIYPYNDHADKYYFREALYNNNTWRSWYEVITSANIGSQTVTSATKATQDGNGRTIASTYLPLAGGTMTGEIGMSIDRSIKWNNKDNASTPALFMMIPDIVNTTGARMVIYPFGWSTIDNVLKGFCIGEKYHNGPLTIASEYDKMYDIGTSDNRFNNIYAETGTIQTSDRKQKKDIKEFDENFIRAFIMGLIPVSYIYKLNSSFIFPILTNIFLYSLLECCIAIIAFFT